MKNHGQFYNYYNMIIHELNFFKVYAKINNVEKNQHNIGANMSNITANMSRINNLESYLTRTHDDVKNDEFKDEKVNYTKNYATY